MSIENKLTYLNGTKDAIKQAIIGKGVSVTEADTFRSYASKIEEIQGGGSGISIPNGMLNLTESVPDTLNVENEFKGVIFSNMNNVTNMVSSFYSLSANIQNIIFPSSIPNVVNMESCFKYCGKITSITLPDLPKVENMSGCFYNCSSLTSITLPSSLPNVTNIGTCFYKCNKLKSVTLLELPKVNYMYGCFMNCSSLTSITLPDLSLVTDIRSCFSYCDSLQNLVIGNINPNITTLTNWGMSDCTRLTVDSLVNIMNALPTITNTRTCTIGTTNLAKLSPEQLAIGTSKGWNIN